MHQSGFLTAAAAAVALAIAFGAPQASAAETEYPYCASANLQEGLDCDYRTFEQCVAAVAGFNRTCVANPFFSGSQAQVSPAPRKRGR
jgi:hypothetical protein